MGTLVVAALALALSVFNTATRLRERMERPRFKALSAEARVDGGTGDAPSQLNSLVSEIACRSGGSSVTIIDARLTLTWIMTDGRTLETGSVERCGETQGSAVITLPSRSVSKFELNAVAPTMTVSSETRALRCIAELDCGNRRYNVPLVLEWNAATSRYVCWGGKWT